MLCHMTLSLGILRPEYTGNFLSQLADQKTNLQKVLQWFLNLMV